MNQRTLKQRIKEEIQKGIDQARQRGVIIPDTDIDVDIVPLPVKEEVEHEI